MQLLLVTDRPEDWGFAKSQINIADAMQYLREENYATYKSVRVINVCESYQYQHIGYYVSLLAQARGQKIVPSVTTIQDIKSQRLANVISQEIEEDIQQ